MNLHYFERGEVTKNLEKQIMTVKPTSPKVNKSSASRPRQRRAGGDITKDCVPSGSNDTIGLLKIPNNVWRGLSGDLRSSVD